MLITIRPPGTRRREIENAAVVAINSAGDAAPALRSEFQSCDPEIPQENSAA